jgi:hypothetical protein
VLARARWWRGRRIRHARACDWLCVEGAKRDRGEIHCTRHPWRHLRGQGPADCRDCALPSTMEASGRCGRGAGSWCSPDGWRVRCAGRKTRAGTTRSRRQGSFWRQGSQGTHDQGGSYGMGSCVMGKAGQKKEASRGMGRRGGGTRGCGRPPCVLNRSRDI